jgi:hypothetical protein
MQYKDVNQDMPSELKPHIKLNDAPIVQQDSRNNRGNSRGGRGGARGGSGARGGAKGGQFGRGNNHQNGRGMKPNLRTAIQFDMDKPRGGFDRQRSGGQDGWIDRGGSGGFFDAKPTIWSKDNMSAEDRLFASFRSILNKLSDSNLMDMYDELTKLDIQTKTQLEKLVELLFSKAISESKYIGMYAKLTKLLADFSITENDVQIQFKPLLINKCQYMFNYGVSLDKDLSTSPDEVYKFKEHVLGCVEYIGELYNYDLLTSKIIMGCFTLLFSKSIKQPYTVDILCTLMKTVGKKFIRQCPTDTNNCLQRMDQLKNDKNIQAKDKFAIMDLLELKRKERWV